MLLKKKQKFQKGFLLVDSLMAIAILTIGLVATVSLVTAGFRQYSSSRDVVIATGLAQEGVELMRNIRDNNMAQIINDTSGTWTENDTFKFFPDFASGRANCIPDKEYTYDPANPGSLSCTDRNVTEPYWGNPFYYKLKISSPGFFVRGGGSDDKFSRRVAITDRSGGKKKEVVAYVWWDGSKGGPPSCTLNNRCVYSKVIFERWK